MQYETVTNFPYNSFFSVAVEEEDIVDMQQIKKNGRDYYEVRSTNVIIDSVSACYSTNSSLHMQRQVPIT